MLSVAIVDTSIFCNLLDIPHMNEEKEDVVQEMRDFIKNGTNLLLPMSSVYETGNHIAQLKLSDGNIRRNYAKKFVEQVEKAISGEAPWRIMQYPDQTQIIDWLRKFPDAAMQGKSIADVSIISEWENFRSKAPNHRVFIWAIDAHLSGYDSHPPQKYNKRFHAHS